MAAEKGSTAEYTHPVAPIIGYSMPDNPAFFGEEPLCLPCWRAEGAPEGDPVHLGALSMHTDCALCGARLAAEEEWKAAGLAWVGGDHIGEARA